MKTFNRKDHWEKIYETKQPDEVSWYQPNPKTSLAFFESFAIPHDAAIIDVGGGDSFLVDHLLDRGYTDITVLDISAKAIARAQERLGKRAQQVKWIVADASDFRAPQKYDFWHDRAAFHFLTSESEVKNYAKTAGESIHPNGILVIGTFSTAGPKKCSGIDICQYSPDALTAVFTDNFEKVDCQTIDHKTPFDTIQNFLFCSFRRRLR